MLYREYEQHGEQHQHRRGCSDRWADGFSNPTKDLPWECPLFRAREEDGKNNLIKGCREREDSAGDYTRQY